MYRVLYRNGWNGQNKLMNADTGSPRLLEGKVTKAVGSYDTFSCTIDPTQAAFSDIQPLVSFITVIRTRPPQRVLFEGRVLDVQPAMGTDGTVNNVINAEGLESFLHDSVQPWTEFHNTSPHDFLQALINQHNSQVEVYKQIKLGTVTMTNSTDNVYRFSDDTKDTYDNIKEKLIDRLGGEIRIRHESTGLFLDYMPVIGEKSDQPIQLRKNLLSMSQKLDPAEIITVLKPLGAVEDRTTEDGETQAVSSPHLTIKSVNDGSPFLRDRRLIDQFGVQVGVQTWDDVKTASALLTKGKAFLTNQKPVKQQVQITAIDLSQAGGSVSDFCCGNYYDIVNPLIDFSQTLRLSAQTIDLVRPQNSTLQVGDKLLSVEDYNTDLNKVAKKVPRLESRLIVVSSKAASANKLAKEAQETASGLKATVDDLEKQIDTADLSNIKDSLKKMGNQLTTLYDNIGDIGDELNTVKAAQTTSTGATLTTIEERVKKLEDAAKPAEGD